MVFCDYKIRNEITGETSTLRSVEFEPERCNLFARILFRQTVHTASMLFKRKCYDDGCRYKSELKYAPDYDFSLQLLEKFTAGYLAEPLYGYRRHATNTTNAHQKQRESEINIVKTLGKERIRRVVEETSFPTHQQESLLAKIFLKIGELDEALTLFRKQALSSRKPSTHFYLGNCYYLGGSAEKSLTHYHTALEQDGNFAEALNNLGCAQVTNGEPEKGRELFAKALIIRPGYMDAEDNLAGKQPLKMTVFELRKTLTHYY